MRYLLGIVLMICSVTGTNAQLSTNVAAVVPVSEQVQSVGELKMGNTLLNYKQTKEWQRYKVLRAVGWGSLGLGVPMFQLCAWGSFAVGYADGGEKYRPFLRGLMWAGAGLTVASIPILITAYRYRYLAKHVSVSVSAVNSPTGSGMGMAYVPAVRVALSF